jgi:hypothetical protein
MRVRTAASVAVAVAGLAAVGSLTVSAEPTRNGVYVGQTSNGHAASVAVSGNGKRGYLTIGTEGACDNGERFDFYVPEDRYRLPPEGGPKVITVRSGPNLELRVRVRVGAKRFSGGVLGGTYTEAGHRTCTADANTFRGRLRSPRR